MKANIKVNNKVYVLHTLYNNMYGDEFPFGIFLTRHIDNDKYSTGVSLVADPVFLSETIDFLSKKLEKIIKPYIK